jgi:glycosyltransferase involved in cell wall biosynthesis
MRVVFWTDFISLHLFPMISALGGRPGYEVFWVVEETVSRERLAQGWAAPKVQNVTVIVAPTDPEVKDILIDRRQSSVHIIYGVHGFALPRKAFYFGVRVGARMGLLNEPPWPRNKRRDAIVPHFHRLHTMVFGRRFNFVLAIGHMAVDFYQSVGYSGRVVFQFGYFPEVKMLPDRVSTGETTVQIIYVGQLIARKGVDILLHAISTLRGMNWNLKIIGNGAQEDSLKLLATSLGLDGRVSFHKSVANAQALEAIAASDVLVLPSRHDGWGAVVNESLLCGVPVICSSKCGAADLLQESWRGSVFQSESAEDLTDKLTTWISRGPRTTSETAQIRLWSSHISGEAAADYFISIIEHTARAGRSNAVKPNAPWLMK